MEGLCFSSGPFPFTIPMSLCHTSEHCDNRHSPLFVGFRDSGPIRDTETGQCVTGDVGEDAVILKPKHFYLMLNI